MTKQYISEEDFLGGADMVNHPPHYGSQDDSGIECIDAIRASMTREMFLGYLKGNAEKYLWRAGKKVDAVEDLEKMEWYSNRYREELRNAG